MSYGNNILTSLYGRRFGLQPITTAQFGISKAVEMLVGPEALRSYSATGETTGTNLPPYGISNCPGTSAGSSSVYVLDPPVLGVPKYITFNSSANGNTYLRTANSETIQTTFGSTFTTVKCTGTGAFSLIPITTAIWMAIGITSGTTSNAGGFAVTTST